VTPPLWPTINAALNATAGLLLIAGFLAVRAGQIPRHRALMAWAFSVSCAFLLSYLLYHSVAGSVRYPGTGWMRTLYLTILLPHTLMAVTIVPFVLRLLFLASQDRFDEHRRLARWVWPSWVFVSVTGVTVYLMLYVIPA
jgi:putative membrane protein